MIDIIIQVFFNYQISQNILKCIISKKLFIYVIIILILLDFLNSGATSIQLLQLIMISKTQTKRNANLLIFTDQTW